MHRRTAREVGDETQRDARVAGCHHRVFGQYLRGTALARRQRPARDADGTIVDRRGVDSWENPPGFKDDTFTFVRIVYRSWGGRGWSGDRWNIDGPDSDLNFSFRLQQLTSMKVNPDPIVLTLTDPRLFDYPFIYIVEPGYLEFSEDEVKALRHYLLNGGLPDGRRLLGRGRVVQFLHADEARLSGPRIAGRAAGARHLPLRLRFEGTAADSIHRHCGAGVQLRAVRCDRKCTIAPITTTTVA